MRAAYERHCLASGQTNVKRLGGPDRVPELIASFVAIVEGAAWDSVGMEPAQLGQAALDIRAYYEEAALALVEHVPAARQAESWFYRSTIDWLGASTRPGDHLRRGRARERPGSRSFPLANHHPDFERTFGSNANRLRVFRVRGRFVTIRQIFLG